MAQRWVKRPEGSNWGDFGADDEYGRMNLITPARRLAGIAEAKEGIVFPLSLPLDVPGGDGITGGLRAPPKLFSRDMHGGCPFPHDDGNDAYLDDGVILYLQGSTQWDSLAHVGRHFDGDGDGEKELLFYNGYRFGTDFIGPDEGGPRAYRLGIDKLAETGAQGRGVLVDLTRIEGIPCAIGYDALMGAIEAQRVEVRTGDFLLLYTGFDRLLLAQADKPDGPALFGQSFGLDGSDARLQRWIADSGVVALCSDNIAVEHIGGMHRHADGGETMMPLHQFCLFGLGIHLGELWYLAELVAWLAQHERSAFLLTAPPLRLPGAVGSPVTPIATV